MLGGLKPFAQHSTILSCPNTTIEEGTNTVGGAVNERKVGFRENSHQGKNDTAA